MYKTIYINNIPMAGVVSEEKETFTTFSVQDLWLSYCKFMEKEIDKPFVCLPEFATWKLNNTIIERPKSWFITI